MHAWRRGRDSSYFYSGPRERDEMLEGIELSNGAEKGARVLEVGELEGRLLVVLQSSWIL